MLKPEPKEQGATLSSKVVLPSGPFVPPTSKAFSQPSAVPLGQPSKSAVQSSPAVVIATPPPAQTMSTTAHPPAVASLFDDAQVVTTRTQWEKSKVTVEFILNALHQALVKRERITVLAALSSIAASGQLSDILKREPRLSILIGEAYQRDGRDAEAAALKLSPSNPRHVKDFVHYAFDQLKLSESDGARAAVDLVNIANRQGSARLQPWAYYDMGTQNYKWL